MNIRLTTITVLAVCTALLVMPGTARAQTPTPTPSDLFASINGPVHQGGNASIYRYTWDGNLTVVASTLFSPRGLVFDPAGNLFVATNTTDDSGNYQGSILKITPDGLMSTFATGFGTNFFLQSVVFDSAGNLFVMAQNNGPDPNNPNPNPPGTIYKVTLDGTAPYGTVSTVGINPGFSHGLAFDSHGVLFAANAGAGINPTIYKYTQATPGVWTQSTFVGPAAFPISPVDPTQVEGPVGLAFDTSGNLFASTADLAGNSTILEFPSVGASPAPTPITFTGMPTNAGARGLAFDSAVPHPNLFVAEIGFNGAGSGAIQEFPSLGGSPPPSPATTPINFASGIGSQTNRGPEYVAFAPANMAVASGVTSAAAVTFPNATVPLTTNVTFPTSTPTPPPSPNFELQTKNGSITGVFEIAYPTPAPSPTPPPPIIIDFSPWDSSLSVLHYDPITSGCDTSCTSNCMPSCWVDSTIHYVCDNTQNPPVCNWVDSTGTLHAPGQGGYPSNPALNTVYASVNSLSPFLIAKFKYAAQVQLPINADGSSVFSVKRSGVPVVFTLTSDGAATCQLRPATISLFRISGGVVGSIPESTYRLKSDNGSNFRISNCQYVYNLGVSSLGPGTYLVNISIGGSVAGSATFALK